MGVLRQQDARDAMPRRKCGSRATRGEKCMFAVMVCWWARWYTKGREDVSSMQKVAMVVLPWDKDGNEDDEGYIC